MSDETPLPTFVHYASAPYNKPIVELAQTEQGRDWLSKQYSMLGNCPLKQAIEKALQTSSIR